MSTREHWEAVYRDKSPDALSWYQAHLARSLAWIDACELSEHAQIVDVGGGASTLVDDLLARGLEGVCVIDLSARALEHAQARVGPAAQRVRWIVGDATAALLEPESVDLWHDRAVFHFLTEPDARAAYLEQLRRCVRPGGYVIIGSFAPGGPKRCSGLPVRRYSPAEIAAALGPSFELLEGAHEQHRTPRGGSQAFAYALCRRRRAPGG